MKSVWNWSFAVALFALGFSANVAIAQSSEQNAAMANIKNDPTRLWVTADGASAEEALNAARAKLSEAARTKFRSIETAIVSALPETEDAASLTTRLKFELRGNAIEWQLPAKKKQPAVFSAFEYADEKEARLFVIDRALAPLRNPKKFKWGEGYAPDAEKARTISRENLIGQISQTIEMATLSSTSEVNGKNSQTFQSRTSAFSKMTLQGVSSTPAVDIDGKNKLVISWITLEDLEKSFAPAKSRVLTALAEAGKYEQLNNFQAALQNYYKAYLYAEGYYSSIPYTFPGESVETPDMRAGAQARIEKILGGMTITMKPAYEITEGAIFIPFEAKYNGQRVSGVQFETTIGSNRIMERVRGGRGRLELSNYEPAEKEETFDLAFGVDISEELQRDAELQLFEPARRLRLIRSINADFSNIFKVTILARFDGPTVYFQAQSKNIAALGGRWDFGDGEISTELNPKHTYEKDGVYKVTLVLNGDSTLTDTKFVYLRDQLLRRTKAEDVAATASAMLLAPVTPPPVPEPVVLPETPAPVVKTPKEEVKGQEPKPQPKSEPLPDPKPEPKPALVKRTEAEIFAGKKEAAKAKDVYEEIRFIEVTDQLMRVLTRKKIAGEFIVGKQSDLPDSEGAMVIVADKKMVLDKLVFSANRFMSLKNGEEITDLKERYAGKSVIWVQAVGKEQL
jgi:hypothetical protein